MQWYIVYKIINLIHNHLAPTWIQFDIMGISQEMTNKVAGILYKTMNLINFFLSFLNLRAGDRSICVLVYQ